MDNEVKPATSKAWTLLRKLEALAAQGIDGEKTSAQAKIVRLKARFDFNIPDAAQTLDLFSGAFKRSATARRIYSFEGDKFDVANSVKWAIESATKIQCVFRGKHLMAEGASATASKLTKIAVHIAGSFSALIEKFNGIDGVSVSDRSAFVMGLYDGMMNETRSPGQLLPGSSRKVKKIKGKKGAVVGVSGLHVHPYTVAVGLGEQIRFSTPLEEITAELAAATQKHLDRKAS